MALQALSSRPSNKELRWQQEPVDDLFESFINPDSFHLANGNVERECSDDLINFFDIQPSLSGSDAIDASPMPVMDATHIEPDARGTALSFLAENAASPTSFMKSSRQCFTYSQACGRSSASESNIFIPQRPGTPIPPLEYSDSAPVPGWSIKDKELFATPLVVRKKPQPSNSGDQKPERRRSASPKMLSPTRYKLSPRHEQWTRHSHSGTSLGQFDFKVPFTHGGPASPPSSTQPKHTDVDYSFEQPIRSPNCFREDIEALSPLSVNEYNVFQLPDTPATSPPTFAKRLASAKSSFEEPQHPQLSAYPPSPYPVHSEHERFLMTPPLTQPMTDTHWTHGLPVSSPPFAPSDKAEHWWDPSMQHTDPSEVTCGAPAAPNMLGLGISNINGANIASIASNGDGIVQLSAVSQGAGPALASSPTPSALSSRKTPFSASASPNPAATAPMYSLSPLQDHAQLRQSQHMQQQPNMYRHHRRHHTMGSTLSISPSVISQLPQLNRRTPSTSPPPAVRSSTHRSTKSSHHTRRKSGVVSATNGNGSRHASVGFVNFTPDDSRKILTGVAPSGSSKTKARREKEAADKRRKLSEAAKKAILEAGGDLGTLEREGLLVMESAL